MNEADVYRALGLEVPSETPAVATPEGAVEAQGGQEQPVAGAASENAQDAEERIATSPSAPRNNGIEGEEAEHPSSGADAPPSPQGEGSGGEMSKEERARQAKLRREREKQEAIDAALAENNKTRDQEITELLKEIGITNRYRNNAPITTREEFLQWQQDAKDAGLQDRLRNGQLTRADLQNAAAESPELQKLREQVDRLLQQQEQQQRQAQQAQIEREIAEITRLDPSIKSIKDALELPTGEEFSRLVQERGLSFTEAFKLANMERLSQQRQQAAQEAQARNYHSKDHLQGIGSNTRTPVTVPQRTYQTYRMLNPNWTDEQIRQDYARQIKDMG